MSDVNQSINYFPVKELIDIHNYAIEKSGGLSGTKNIGLLESVLNHIQNDQYYPTFYDKLSHLTFSVAKNHCFNDGNKRSSIGASIIFISRNSSVANDQFSMDNYIMSMEFIIVFVVENVISKQELQLIQIFWGWHR